MAYEKRGRQADSLKTNLKVGITIGGRPIFGVLGYFLRKFDYEATPIVFAVVLGPMFEVALRQSLLLSNGSFLIFITRPISASLLAAAVTLLIMAFVFKRRPGKDLREEEG